MMKSSLIRINLIFILLILFIPNLVSAELKTFIKEYAYQASEFDSKASSRILALEQTKRLLLEELGTYLISETEVKDFQLTKDAITILTAGIVQATILDEKWDGKIYYLKAKISADTQELARALDKLRQDKQKSKELENAQKRADELEKELIRLRQELTAKADSVKIKEYSDTVNKLSATDWVQKGYSLLKDNLSAKENKEALEAFNKALELNSDMPEIYLMRAKMFYYDEGEKDYDKILADIDKSIQVQNASNNSLTVAEQRSFRAKIYKEQGDYRKALQELEVAVTLNPEDVYHRRHIDPGEEDKRAIWNKKDLDEIIRKYPKDYRGYMFRGLYYDFILSKNYKEAIADYNKAISLHPKAPMPYYLAGKLYNRMAFMAFGIIPERENAYRKAIEAFSKAIKLNPTYSEAYRGRAEAYIQIKEDKKAIADYDKVLEFNPDSGGTFFARGSAYRGLFQFKDAISDFTKAIEAKNKPDFIRIEDVYAERGSTYHQMWQFDKAISDFDKAIALRKDIAKNFAEDSHYKGHDIGTSTLYVKRGWTYFYSARMKYAGDIDSEALLSKSPELRAAIADFNMAIEAWTINMDAYEKRAEALAAAKKYKEALQDVEVELNFCLKDKINPGDVYRQRALIYSELGNFSQAVDDFNKAIAYAEDPAIMHIIYYHRGLAYLNLKRDQEAMKDFSETITLSPKYWPAYINRGVAYCNMANYSAAIADFDKAITIEPSSGYAYYHRGLVHILLLKHEEGIADYKIAARLGHKEAQDMLRKNNIEW